MRGPNHPRHSSAKTLRVFPLLPGGDLSRLGNGERNSVGDRRPVGPNERERVSPRRDEGERHTIIGFMGRSLINPSIGQPTMAFHKYLFYKFLQKTGSWGGVNILINQSPHGMCPTIIRFMRREKTRRKPPLRCIAGLLTF